MIIKGGREGIGRASGINEFSDSTMLEILYSLAEEANQLGKSRIFIDLSKTKKIDIVEKMDSTFISFGLDDGGNYFMESSNSGLVYASNAKKKFGFNKDLHKSFLFLSGNKKFQKSLSNIFKSVGAFKYDAELFPMLTHTPDEDGNVIFVATKYSADKFGKAGGFTIFKSQVWDKDNQGWIRPEPDVNEKLISLMKHESITNGLEKEWKIYTNDEDMAHKIKVAIELPPEIEDAIKNKEALSKSIETIKRNGAGKENLISELRRVRERLQNHLDEFADKTHSKLGDENSYIEGVVLRVKKSNGEIFEIKGTSKKFDSFKRFIWADRTNILNVEKEFDKKLYEIMDFKSFSPASINNFIKQAEKDFKSNENDPEKRKKEFFIFLVPYVSNSQIDVTSALGGILNLSRDAENKLNAIMEEMKQKEGLDVNSIEKTKTIHDQVSKRIQEISSVKQRDSLSTLLGIVLGRRIEKIIDFDVDVKVSEKENAEPKKIIVWVGKAQPWHIGHSQMIAEGKRHLKELGANAIYILIVRGKDAGPLGEKEQRELINSIYKDDPEVFVSDRFPHSGFPFVIADIVAKDRAQIVGWLAGEDRSSSYHDLIQKFDPKRFMVDHKFSPFVQNENGEMDLKIIETPRIMSGTKAREAAKTLGFNEWANLVIPKGVSEETIKLYDNIYQILRGENKKEEDPRGQDMREEKKNKFSIYQFILETILNEVSTYKTKPHVDLIDEVSVKDLKTKYPDYALAISMFAEELENKYVYPALRFYAIEGNPHGNVEPYVKKLNLYNKILKQGKIKRAIETGQWNSKFDDIEWVSKNLTFDAFADKVDIIETEFESPADIKKKAESGNEKIYEDENYLVLWIKSHEASCYYGKGTDWCITKEEGRYWDHYSEKYHIAFIFDKRLSKDKKNKDRKTAMIVRKDKEEYLCYDLNDKEGKCEQIPQEVKTKISVFFLEEDITSEENRVIPRLKGAGGVLTENGWEFLGNEGERNKNINLQEMKLTTLPKFHIVEGYMDVGENHLTSLKGCPREVGYYFSCAYNELRTLEGGPEIVGKDKSYEYSDFNCNSNNLTNLIGAPKYVGGDFKCLYNYISSLEGFPQYVGGDVYIGIRHELDEKEVEKLIQFKKDGRIKGEIFMGDHVLRESSAMSAGAVEGGSTKSPFIGMKKKEHIYEDETIEEEIDPKTREKIENLASKDLIKVYHGTSISDLPLFINGFDATKIQPRMYGGPRHAGIFVTADIEEAIRFSHYQEAVLELLVRAKNLHGVDFSGNITRKQNIDPKTKEWIKDKYPNSFRPHLSMTMLQSSEPQGLLVGLVGPKQILRIRYAPYKQGEPKWYTREEFVKSGLVVPEKDNPYNKSGVSIEDFGLNKASTTLKPEDFIRAVSKTLGGNSTIENVKETFKRYMTQEDGFKNLLGNFLDGDKAINAMAKKLYDYLGKKETIQEDESLEEDKYVIDVNKVKEIIQNLLNEFFSKDSKGNDISLPIPTIEIVKQVGKGWAARDKWNSANPDNTVLQINAYVTNDEKQLEQFIAHELIHHYQFLVNKMGKMGNFTMKYYAHGSSFKSFADKINAVKGENFVTEKSSDSRTQEVDKEFYILLKKHGNAIGWMWAQRPSKQQKETMERLIREKGWTLTNSNDYNLTQGPRVSKTARYAFTRDAERTKALEDLYQKALSNPIAINEVKTYDTQSVSREPYQRLMRKLHPGHKEKLIGRGGQKADVAGSPYKTKPSMERSKSAPPIGESIDLIDEVSVKDLKAKYSDYSNYIDYAIDEQLPNKYFPLLIKDLKRNDSFKTIEDLASITHDPYEIDKFVKTCEEFDKLLQSKKIFSLIKQEKLPKNSDNISSYDSLYGLLKTVEIAKKEVSISQKKEKAKHEGAEKIYEDNDYSLYHIKTMESSCFYGSGTKWCISAKEQNMFKEYYDQGANFYFIIKKNGDPKDPLYKIAFATVRGKHEIYDATDELIELGEVEKELGFDRVTKILNIVGSIDREENKRIAKRKLQHALERHGGVLTENGWVFTHGLNLRGLGLTKLPKIYSIGKGSLILANNNLASLEGCPEEVPGRFECDYNRNLISLEGGPKKVGENYVCSYGRLKSLKGAAETVEGSFNCSFNNLISLEGAPLYVGGDFYCARNELTSLDNGPDYVGGDFYAESMNIEDHFKNPTGWFSGNETKIGGQVLFENKQPSQFSLSELKDIITSSIKEIKNDRQN